MGKHFVFNGFPWYIEYTPLSVPFYVGAQNMSGDSLGALGSFGAGAITEGTLGGLGRFFFGGAATTISASAKGNPLAIVKGLGELSSGQADVLAALPKFGASTIVKKSSFGLNDLAALTAQTGDEFAMFSTGGRRLIIRGSSEGVPITPAGGMRLGEQGWRWTAHTQPGFTPSALRSSVGDRLVLGAMGGRRSTILNSFGERGLFSPGGDLIRSNWLPR